jgi:hypothetical protein
MTAEVGTSRPPRREAPPRAAHRPVCCGHRARPTGSLRPALPPPSPTVGRELVFESGSYTPGTDVQSALAPAIAIAAMAIPPLDGQHPAWAVEMPPFRHAIPPNGDPLGMNHDDAWICAACDIRVHETGVLGSSRHNQQLERRSSTSAAGASATVLPTLCGGRPMWESAAANETALFRELPLRALRRTLPPTTATAPELFAPGLLLRFEQGYPARDLLSGWPDPGLRAGPVRHAQAKAVWLGALSSPPTSVRSSSPTSPDSMRRATSKF